MAQLLEHCTMVSGIINNNNNNNNNNNMFICTNLEEITMIFRKREGKKKKCICICILLLGLIIIVFYLFRILEPALCFFIPSLFSL